MLQRRRRGDRRVGSLRCLGGVFAAVSTFFAQPCDCHCEAKTVELIRIEPNGSERQAHVQAHGGEATPMVVYFSLSDTSSAAIEVAIEGPTGLRGAAFGARYESSVLDQHLSDVPWQLATRMKLRREVGPQAKEFDGFVITGEGERGMVRFLYQAQKDACEMYTTHSYVTGVWFDVSGVAPEVLAKGFSIRFAMQEYKFQGARVASIKPASDGKYRGEPILLMGAVQYGGEYVNVIRRSRRGVRSRRRIPVVKYVSYKGYLLSLARLRGILRGGHATFELTNGGLVYGVCFALQRRRQVANGYPLP